MNREQRVKVAEATIEAINQGFVATENKQFNFTPQIYETIYVDGSCILNKQPTGIHNNKIRVTNRDTFAAARDYADTKTLVLNFASPKHPGGGFLTGAGAQEECLCRASTLYASLTSNEGKKYYQAQRPFLRGLYSDTLLLSPHVIVFKGESGRLLKTPFETAVITSPAVNVNVALRSGFTQEQIDRAMLERIRRIIKIAAIYEYDNIILGAWGCGVFGNEPKKVASMFKQVLVNEFYRVCFKNIEFAVLDNSTNKETYFAFANTLKNL